MAQTTPSAAPVAPRKPLPESLFYMWRAVITIAHADGIMHETELAHLGTVFFNLNLAYAVSAPEREMLAVDLNIPQDIDALLPKITDPEMRCLLVSFAHVVARVDGVLHPDEAALLEKLDAAVPDTEETRKIRQDIKRDIVAQMARRAGDMQEPGGAQGCPMTYALNALLGRLGIPLLPD